MLREILVYTSVYIGLFAVVYFFLSFILNRKRVQELQENELPTVSVIIPAYNEESSIKETVLSALNSNYPKQKLEIIVVDDGSRDETYQIAKRIKEQRLRVFTKQNAGKASALNYGIAKSKGEIIITMDADTFAEKDAVKKIIRYFSNPKIMCVTPSMAVHEPKGLLSRIQQIEYLFGVYLRKAFASMNAIHVTPGAFSAYRKSFFTRYGGFEVGNITEDMEMSLRIQLNNFGIECSEDAVVYTKAPRTFVSLLKQRRRWNFGLAKNLWHYRALFSRKYGELGTIVLPIAVITILLPIFMTVYLSIISLIRLQKELSLFESINFNFSNLFDVNKFVFERFFFVFFSNPVSIFLVLFMLLLIGYMFFAKKRVQKYSNVKLSIFFFLAFYSLLFAFWWLVAFFYVVFIGKVAWGKNKIGKYKNGRKYG